MQKVQELSPLKKTLFTLLTVLLVLVVTEVVLRLFVPVGKVGPVGTRYDPFYGKVLKESYSCYRSSPDYRYLLSTNSLGFRGPEPPSPPQGVVLFIGDSMTMGSGVSDGEEYPAIIRRRLDDKFGENAIPVVNAGVANNGNGRWLKFLQTGAKEFQPRFVVMQVCWNDFRDNGSEKLFQLSESGALEELPVPPQSRLQKLQAFVEAIPVVKDTHLMALIRMAIAKKYMRFAHAADDPRSDELTYEILEESLRVCQTNAWPTMWITEEMSENRLKRLEQLFAQYDAPHVKVPSKRERPDLYFPKDPHWNVDGNLWVAEAVLERLLADPRFDQNRQDNAGQ